MNNSAAYFKECTTAASAVVHMLDHYGRSSGAFADASESLRALIEQRPDFTDQYDTSWTNEYFVEVALHSPDRGYWVRTDAAVFFIQLPDLTVHIIGDGLGPSICHIPVHWRDRLVSEVVRRDIIGVIASARDDGVRWGHQAGWWQKADEREHLRGSGLPSPVSAGIQAPGVKPTRATRKGSKTVVDQCARDQMTFPF